MPVRSYREDPLYPRIVRAVDQILARSKVVAPVDALVGMSLPARCATIALIITGYSMQAMIRTTR